eukprot:TRINITY_DN56518_c0_g1_i3.p1 TRINITY_DN56518_c0_g1~~TRINITY_DN56518_c0_g1_i3.p1  ORF type:complete len:376 (+),score=17.83 TRINITY_DN56518_c0_g1_i3:35-1162(+)
MSPMGDVTCMSADCEDSSQQLRLHIVSISGEARGTISVSSEACPLSVKRSLGLEPAFRRHHLLLFDGCVLEDGCRLVDRGVSNDSTLTHVIDESCLSAVSPGDLFTARLSQGWLNLVRNSDGSEVGHWNLNSANSWKWPLSFLEEHDPEHPGISKELWDSHFKSGSEAVLNATHMRFSEESFAIYILTSQKAGEGYFQGIQSVMPATGKFFPPHLIFDISHEFARSLNSEYDSDEVDVLAQPHWLHIRSPGSSKLTLVPSHPKWAFRNLDGMCVIKAARYWEAGEVREGCSYRLATQERNDDGVMVDLPITRELFSWLGDELEDDAWTVLMTPLFMKMREAREQERMQLEDGKIIHGCSANVLRQHGGSVCHRPG